MQELVRELLRELGEDVDREGLVRTPARVEKALKFLTSGYHANIDEVLNDALFTVDYSEMVIVKDIDFTASANTTCCRSSASATWPTSPGRRCWG
jgi:GTP cyclohydrolase IA